MSNGASSPLGGSSDGDVDMDTDTLVNGNDDEATPRPEPINENAPVNIMPLLSRHQSKAEQHDVCIIGAGPAGLMLGYGEQPNHQPLTPSHSVASYPDIDISIPRTTHRYPC